MTETIENITDFLPAIERVDADLKRSAELLTDREARYLVDAYYAMQENRKASDNQVLALGKSGEPHKAVAWLAKQNDALELRIKQMLDVFSAGRPIGRWARSIDGIGPVIAAGLLAHIDIAKAPTVGHIWRFAGLDPTVKWNKGEKRPWNASLKTLCWKISESFVKVCNKPTAYYGHVYQRRKLYEQGRNEAGELADQAAGMLERKKFGKDTVAYGAYAKGRLPDAHVQARAKRYAVKLFLSHYHHVLHELTYGAPPPLPYPIAHLQHAHYLSPPNREAAA